jgi:hypothetical protein
MPDFKLMTPVAFIVFNRPDTTERVFAEIAKARPPKLLVIGDGARSGKSGEAEKVEACRAIIKRVDWDCEVLTNFSEVNLGCKRRVSSGIDWVFEQVEEAIILEDDCLPEPTFFKFCQELLEKYRHDERVSMISGDNFQFGKKRGDGSYYFSNFHHIWGWATWRRAWSNYDRDAKIWPKMRDGRWLGSLGLGESGNQFWSKNFQAVFNGAIDTWDYQWVLSSWSQGRLAVIPQVNLISNIGFGQEATHTTGTSVYADMACEAMQFPLTHPDIFLASKVADDYTAENMFPSSFLQQVRIKLKSYLKPAVR